MGSRPKFEYVRSEAYRRYVASTPCLACAVEGFGQACHPNQAKYGKGRGIKAGDQFAFSLCGPHWGLPGCHWQLDNLVDMSKEEQMAFEDEYIERQQALALEAGWLNGRKMK